MPSFDGATEWINCAATARDLLGRPTIVYFWAVSCYICKNNLPTLREWKRSYGPDGLNLVSVHMPRQETDTNVAAIHAVIAEFDIDEPVAVDGYHEIGDRYQTGGFWPHYFLFDSAGKLRGRAAGDVGLAQIEKTLKRLMDADAALVA